MTKQLPQIRTLQLRCENPTAQIEFYTDNLGMKANTDGTVGYSDEEARLSFLKATGPYSPESNDLYWKIAIAVPDIALACKQLTDLGVAVGAPTQFQDIGYLAHFKDPAGFTVELIDHAFKGDNRIAKVNKNTLGGGPHLNLITLRSVDIRASRNYCEKLGMKLLSIQPVESHNFTLYFYAFTNETPPSRHLTAIENRTWLYQRPYTILEIQHDERLTAVRMPSKSDAGYAGTFISGLAKGGKR